MADAKKKKAGGVAPSTEGVVVSNEEKLKQWVVSQIPDAVKCPNAGEMLIYVANELQKLRKAKPAEGSGTTGGSVQVMEGITRLENSLKQLKEQFSTMRQFASSMK